MRSPWVISNACLCLLSFNHIFQLYVSCMVDGNNYMHFFILWGSTVLPKSMWRFVMLNYQFTYIFTPRCHLTRKQILQLWSCSDCNGLLCKWTLTTWKSKPVSVYSDVLLAQTLTKHLPGYASVVFCRHHTTFQAAALTRGTTQKVRPQWQTCTSKTALQGGNTHREKTAQWQLARISWVVLLLWKDVM